MLIFWKVFLFQNSDQGFVVAVFRQNPISTQHTQCASRGSSPGFSFSSENPIVFATKFHCSPRDGWRAEDFVGFELSNIKQRTWGNRTANYGVDCPVSLSLSTYGYGSIPINTIFRGMNIHLPAILMFTRGTRFWPTAIYLHNIGYRDRLIQLHTCMHACSMKR